MKRDVTKKCLFAGLTAGLALTAVLAAGRADAAQRAVLGEQFTATWCGPCVNVRTASNMLIDNYSDDLVMLQIHVWQDGYDFPWTNNRADFYDVAGVPTVWIDGVSLQYGSAGTVQANYDNLNNLIQQRLAVPTDIDLQVYGEQVSGPTFNITAKVTRETSGSGGLRIYMLPILDYYPASANYRNCPMQAAYEESFLLLTGETKTFEHQFTFDATSWAHQSNIKIACWVAGTQAGPTEVRNSRMMSWPFPPPPADCPADTNSDGVVNVLDLLDVLAVWGATGGPQDVNGDGVVNVLDLLEVLAAWGPC